MTFLKTENPTLHYNYFQIFTVVVLFQKTPK